LVQDVPTIIAGFKPENFVQRNDGAVPADEALWRSLNIPAVLMLREYGIDKLRNHLVEAGFTTINRPSDNYGLSLILGGAEVTAWELASAYQRMAQRLRCFNQHDVREYPAIHLLQGETPKSPALRTNAGAIYTTFEALKKVNRPDSEMGWQYFRKANIAWKTGTSFGHRDAWAVGITPTHIAVVWIGNADGEGRPGLIGAETAGPVLFDLLNQLPQSNWFPEPHTEMKEALVCPQSGLPVSRYCPETDTIHVPLHKKAKAQCSYHQQVFTDVGGRYRLHRNCAEGEELVSRSYFVLPPVMAWYYAQQHSDYEGLPEWRPGCDPNENSSMQMIYPKKGATVFLPRELDGSQHRLILEVAHQQAHKKLYWHLNGEYMGHTEDFHQKPLLVGPGVYRLLIEDENGQTLRTTFTVSER
ncbi:MAG: penicillin-binding protein 1C, partial [Owenweeksia sp.]